MPDLILVITGRRSNHGQAEGGKGALNRDLQEDRPIPEQALLCGGAPAFVDPDSGVMSQTEKRILASIIEPSPVMPYPLRVLPMRYGPPAQEYVIPDTMRSAVLQSLYPFFPCPGLQEIRYDLHEEKNFRVADYKVIRENGRNYLVSPYYAHSGGMVIDWMEGENTDTQILMTTK